MSTPMLMSWCPGGKCDPCKTPSISNVWISGKYCINPDGSFGGPDCVTATGAALTLIPLNPYRLVSLTITYTVRGAAPDTHKIVSASVQTTSSGFYGGGSYQGALPFPYAPLPLQALNLNIDFGYPFIRDSAGFFYPASLTMAVSGADDFGPAPIPPNLFLEDSSGNLSPFQYLYG